MDNDTTPSRPVRVRFAPSPTGTLHVGSARTALYNFLFARHTGGSFAIRIEDTDVARSSREYEESVMKDLAWLGLEWGEGPDTGGGYGPYRQSERLEIYRKAAERLLDEGKAYYCFCSQERLEQLKKESLARGEMPKYDRKCHGIKREDAEERIAAGEAATIRFRVPKTLVDFNDLIHGRTSFSSDVLGDFIIVRSEGGVSYNFAVVVDDAAMEITHVIRGEDHLTNTARQLLVFDALGHERPRYAHHSLIMGPDGSKLSKRHGATSVGDFREMGYLPAAIINYLALLSWSPSGEREKVSKEEMEQEFDIESLSRSPAIFDIQKLSWLNGLYIRDMEASELREAVAPFIGSRDFDISGGQMAVAEAAVKTSLTTLADAPGQIEDFFKVEELTDCDDAAEIIDPQSAAVLEKTIARLEELPRTEDLAAGDAEDALASVRELMGSLKKECKVDDIPPKRLFRTLRIALSGKTSGPEIPFLLAALGSETVRGRLEAALEYIEEHR